MFLADARSLAKRMESPRCLARLAARDPEQGQRMEGGRRVGAPEHEAVRNRHSTLPDQAGARPGRGKLHTRLRAHDLSMDASRLDPEGPQRPALKVIMRAMVLGRRQNNVEIDP